MAEEIFTTSSPKAIEGLIEEWSSFTPASRALDGLTPEQAVTKLENWPHSIAEVIAHMLYWQRSDFTTIETGTEPPTIQEENWPVVTKDDWPRLKDEFLESLGKGREMTRTENLERLILDGKYSIGLRMV